jgi:hypothetical protein
MANLFSRSSLPCELVSMLGVSEQSGQGTELNTRQLGLQVIKAVRALNSEE